MVLGTQKGPKVLEQWVLGPLGFRAQGCKLVGFGLRFASSSVGFGFGVFPGPDAAPLHETQLEQCPKPFTRHPTPEDTFAEHASNSEKDR